METLTAVIEWMEKHPAVTQTSGMITAAFIALLAALIAYKGVKKRIGAMLDSENRARKFERTTIYAAFAADLDAL